MPRLRGFSRLITPVIRDHERPTGGIHQLLQAGENKEKETRPPRRRSRRVDEAITPGMQFFH